MTVKNPLVKLAYTTRDHSMPTAVDHHEAGSARFLSNKQSKGFVSYLNHIIAVMIIKFQTISIQKKENCWF